MEGTPRAGSGARPGEGLLTLAREEASERQMLERLLDLWRREHGAEAAGLYLERGGLLHQESAAGDSPPDPVQATPADGLGSVAFPGGCLLFSPAGAAAEVAASAPLTLLLASAL